LKNSDAKKLLLLVARGAFSARHGRESGGAAPAIHAFLASPFPTPMPSGQKFFGYFFSKK